jgi:cyclase
VSVLEVDSAAHEIAPGTYALIAPRVPDPNGGVVQGENACLAVDCPPDVRAGYRVDTGPLRQVSSIDLGGRVVWLLDSGIGGTIVHVPDCAVAWTGRFLCHAGTPPRVGNDPQGYLKSLCDRRNELSGVRTIVPGYGPLDSGADAVAWAIRYAEDLLRDIDRLVGYSIGEMLHRCRSPFDNGLDPRLVAALAPRVRPGYLKLCRNLHLLNVLTTYKALGA